MSRRVVGVMGPGRCDEHAASLAFEVGRLVARRGAVLLCGGLSGAMEHAARGAKEEGGTTLGILPGRGPEESRPNPYIDLPVYTGLGEARNVVNVLTSDALIAVAGGAGTLSEIALALKVGKPVVLLESWKLEPPGSEPLTRLRREATPEAAVQAAFELMGPE